MVVVVVVFEGEEGKNVDVMAAFSLEVRGLRRGVLPPPPMPPMPGGRGGCRVCGLPCGFIVVLVLDLIA